MEGKEGNLQRISNKLWSYSTLMEGELNLQSLMYTAHHDFLQSQMGGGYTLTLCGEKKQTHNISGR